MPQAVIGMVSFDSGDTAENTWLGHRHTLLTSVLYLSFAITLEKRNPIVIIMAQTPNTLTG